MSVLKTGSYKKTIYCHYCKKPGYKQRECRKLASDQEAGTRNTKNKPKYTKNPPKAKARSNKWKLHFHSEKDYVRIPKQNRSKFDAAAQQITFLGYSSQQKAFRFLDRSTGKIVNSRDAQFLQTSVCREEENEKWSFTEYHFSPIENSASNSLPIVAGDVLGELVDSSSEELTLDYEDDTGDASSDDDAILTEQLDTVERPLNAPSEPTTTSISIRVSSRVNRRVSLERFAK